MIKKEIVIRSLERKDSEKLAKFLQKLSNDVFVLWNRFGFSSADFKTKKTAKKMCVMPLSKEKGFVCLDSRGDIVAYSYLRFFSEKITKKHNASLGIVVHQNYQRQGIGERLMLHMHDWARQKNIKKIWLATYSHNEKSLNLYKKLGYEVEGIFMYDEFTNSGWAHVVSMALMLDSDLTDSKEKRRQLIEKIEQ